MNHQPQPPHPSPDKPRKVYLETFGCQMNVLDSHLVRGQLHALGYTFTDDWKSANIILYNTCSVREHAENKVYSRIGEVGLHKKQHPDILLGVIGCMAERDGLDIAKRYPQIDLLCGPGELDKIPMLIDNTIKTRPTTRKKRTSDTQQALQGNTHRRSSTLAAAEDHLEMLDLSRSFAPEEFQGTAYVRITRGCNKFCTFCVVPYTRGAEIHRPPDHIVDECKKLADAGVVEITLLGQTVNHYHYHHAATVTVSGIQQPQIGRTVTRNTLWNSPRVTTFAQLLARIHDQVPHLPRLRFVTNFPRDFGDDILEVIATHPRICRYLHIPAQSGSNRLLALMNRGYTVEEYKNLLLRARAALPDVQIAGDLICGFPTETDQDHQASCDLLRHAQYKNCFIFKYSPRPGTTAIDRFTDDVPEHLKRTRNNDLLKIQSAVSARIHQTFIGKTVRAFVESVSCKTARANAANTPDTVTLTWEKPPTQLTSRTDGDLIVVFDGHPSLVGSIVDVKIDHATPLTLFGTLAHHPVPA
jgi:tRNA-2-methylthio-N6-dimethylallyladenosine synthase